MDARGCTARAANAPQMTARTAAIITFALVLIFWLGVVYWLAVTR